MVAGNHKDSVAAELEVFLQTNTEAVNVFVLFLFAPLRQVAREYHQVRSEPFAITKLVQVVGQSLQKRVELLITTAQV